MDQIKIGRFIAERRKAVGLTQMQLAEKLAITDRAVSKWENGKAMPDSSIMLALCKELQISVNDLLSGEVVTVENYNEKLEKNLLEAVQQKELADKRLLSLEILIGAMTTIVFLSLVFIASFVQMDAWLRILLIILGAVQFFISVTYALKIEQVAGYYECSKCHHKYVPTFKSVLLAMHSGRTRYMKCPQCGQKSWQKKRVSKD